MTPNAPNQLVRSIIDIVTALAPGSRLKGNPAVAAGVSAKLWEASDVVEMLEQSEWTNVWP